MFLIKTIITIGIILAATAIGKKFPSAAGLIGVMPLTGSIVLVWVYLENKGDCNVMQEFTKGAIWGILPSILFFVTALICIKNQFPIHIILFLSFIAWLIAAFIHQMILN